MIKPTHLEIDMGKSHTDITNIPSRRALLQALLAMPALAWHSSSAEILKSLASANPLSAFDLSAVRLLPGPFKTAQQLDAKYMLSLEPDRLLHNFRVNAGLEPKAPVYGGWESQEPWVDIRCQGHTLGHYLSACAMMAAAGEPQFHERVTYIVAELGACQEARGDGLICAFPDGAAQLENGLNGKPVTGVPWYTLHKIMAGLRDACTMANNRQALAVLQGLGGWVITAARPLRAPPLQKKPHCEPWGLDEGVPGP